MPTIKSESACVLTKASHPASSRSLRPGERPAHQPTALVWTTRSFNTRRTEHLAPAAAIIHGRPQAKTERPTCASRCREEGSSSTELNVQLSAERTQAKQAEAEQSGSRAAVWNRWGERQVHLQNGWRAINFPIIQRKRIVSRGSIICACVCGGSVWTGIAQHTEPVNSQHQAIILRDVERFAVSHRDCARHHDGDIIHCVTRFAAASQNRGPAGCQPSPDGITVSSGCAVKREAPIRNTKRNVRRPARDGTSIAPVISAPLIETSDNVRSCDGRATENCGPQQCCYD